MRAPARGYMCTHPCTVCFGSWVEGESSITGFIFLCLTPFLLSSGCFCSECLQRAHHSPARRNDVFITVTTKDIACPPTLPPALLLYPGAALLVPSRRLCPLFGEEPLAHMPSAPVLRPEHLSRSLAERRAATCPETPSLAPSPLTRALSRKRCRKISLLFLLSSKACQSHWTMPLLLDHAEPQLTLALPLLFPAGSPQPLRVAGSGESPAPKAVEQSSTGISDRWGKRKLSPTG